MIDPAHIVSNHAKAKITRMLKSDSAALIKVAHVADMTSAHDLSQVAPVTCFTYYPLRKVAELSVGALDVYWTLHCS